MSSSIIQTVKQCIVCGEQIVEKHHVFFGIANRGKSEEDGCWCWLCAEHHRGTNGVHGKDGSSLNRALKLKCQKAWEQKIGTRDEFIARYGRAYDC